MNLYAEYLKVFISSKSTFSIKKIKFFFSKGRFYVVSIAIDFIIDTDNINVFFYA